MIWLVVSAVVAFVLLSMLMSNRPLRNDPAELEEEARALRALTRTALLIYHPDSFVVLRGTFRGRDVHDTCRQFERAGYRSKPVHVRPWWRAYRLTPAFHLRETTHA